MLMIRGL